MNQTDNRILELLDESDLILSPVILAVNLDYTRNWVSRRLTELHKHGLVEKVNGSQYVISDKGRAYLEGEIDASELEEDE